MATSTVHNPVNFDPSKYEVVDYLDNRRPLFWGDVESYEAEVVWWEQDMKNNFGVDWKTKIHRCVHCGNSNVRWITAVRHIPTNTVVAFGADCTHRLHFLNRNDFKLAQLQKKAQNAKMRFVIWTKKQEFLKTHPEIVAALAEIVNPIHERNMFAKDVLGNLDRYGSLSERQITAVLASLKRDEEFARRKAEEALEVKGDAPSGRVAVTGEVLSKKDKQTDFGWVTKLLIKLANNSRVYVSNPSGLVAEVGAMVTLTATWTPKVDDKSFAFGSRPHAK